MKRMMTAVALAGALAASAAHAGDGPPSDKLDLPLEDAKTSAVVNVPSNDQMQREYPLLALAVDMGGSGTITCTVETTGLLTDCKLEGESPAGLGFGAAALRLAPYFTAKPTTIAGKLVKGSVTIPIKFQTAGPPPVEPAPIPPPTSPAALVAAKELAEVEHWPDKEQEFGDKTFAAWTERLADGGDAGSASRVLDAFRFGVDEAVKQNVDERERLIASKMTAEQLRALVAFMKSPPGAAYLRALTDMESDKRPGFWQTVTASARRHLCASVTCESATADSPAP